MQLTEDVLRNFGMGRVFKACLTGISHPTECFHNACMSQTTLCNLMQNYQGRVNSLDFHRSEDLLVTAGDDDAIRLYNTQNGSEIKQLFSKKYGVCNICYTHAPQAVVYASNKVTAEGDSTMAHTFCCMPSGIGPFAVRAKLS